MVSYFLSPIPFTFFKSSALRNGRAAIIREAITGPMPGIIFNSFSVAVLMSILPSAIFSFACDLSASTGLIVAIEGLGAGVADAGAYRARGFAWWSLLSGSENTKNKRIPCALVQAPEINAPTSDLLLSRVVLELLKSLQFRTRTRETGRNCFGAVDSGEPVTHQLLAKISVLGSNKRVKPL